MNPRLRVLILLLCGLCSSANTYQILLSLGAASHTTEATNQSLWPYSAANVDGGNVWRQVGVGRQLINYQSDIADRHGRQALRASEDGATLS